MLMYGHRVPNIIAASIAISVLGFFSGPLFAAVSHTTTLPSEILDHTQAYTSPGNVGRITIVSVRDKIHCTLSGLRLCADGRVDLPNNHRSPQHQIRCEGVAADLGVPDRSHYNLLVPHP